MKVLVVEIDKDTLKNCLQVFNIADPITFLDGLKVPDEDEKYETSFDYDPYYIEESIADLDKVIALCDDVYYVRQRMQYGDIGGFFELLVNIKKQRDFGCYLDDMEYIYKTGLRLDLPIEYNLASELFDHPKSDDFYVITGQSDLGKIELYNQYGFDFTLIFSRNKTKKFTEMDITEVSHWHPNSCIDAINDMVAILTNDEEYFRKNGISI
ncbi:MAG: hypothetical protein K2F90_01495 [Clostridiales bacterium]|nr:hypothetical protein [Clostridiales bacterium]